MKTLSIQRNQILNGLLAISPLVIFLIFNYQNLLLKFSLLLGLIVFPYVLTVQPRKGNYRFAIIAGLIGFALIFVRSNSLYYFSTMFLILFIIEKWFGHINILPPLLVIIVSPVISAMVYIWSFPIRLALSDIAGKALQAVAFDIKIQGNLVLMDGNIFSVDEACIGLNMVTTALVLGIVIIAYFEKKHQKSIKFVQTIPLFTAMLLLTIAANFIRLLTLIIFHILPENPLHDIIGLISLVAYALLPFFFIVRFFFNKMKTNTLYTKKTNVHIFPNRIDKIILTLLLGLQLYISPQFLQTKIENTQTVDQLTISDFEKTVTDKGILKFQNEEALLYIKPPVRFFQGSHDPRFCWKGSGYEFSNIQLQEIDEQTIYTATLTKENDILYSAWWYQSDDFQTPYEWTWRWKSLSSKENFYMVNLNCEDKSTLDKWLRNLNKAFEL